MTKDKGIFIKNIYYMLAYAFRILRQKNYDEIAAEEFDDIQDLFAVILAKGVSQQLKQGLHKEYITKNEDLSVMTYEGRIRAAVRANGTGKIKVTFTTGDKNCSVTIPAE